MGCAGSRGAAGSADSPAAADAPPKNRFGRVEGLRAEDFSCSGEEGVLFVKHSGEIMGQQFVVDNCDSCNLFLLDHIASATLDKCTSCVIITGPVSSSLFMRDCRDCTLVTVCQQIRLRNCSNIRLFVCSSTGPIIESSSGVGFGCYNYDYEDLAMHYDEAKLSSWNNYWYDVYDFTPAVGNFYYLPVECDPYTQLRVSIEDQEIQRAVPEDRMLVLPPSSERPPHVLPTRGMVFQSLSQGNNVLLIMPEAFDEMLRKVLYDWINMYGKSFYTVNLRRLESMKKDDPADSFESLDVDDVFLEGVVTDASPVGRAQYDHLSSTVATHNSSGDLDKDPNIVVRTMKRALKKKNIESFWGSMKKAKSVGLKEDDVVIVAQVYGPDAVNLRKMIEAEEAAAAQGPGLKKSSKGGRPAIIYEGAEALEKIPVVFEQWKEALF